MSAGDTDEPDDGPVQFMRQMISLDYIAHTSPLARDFGERLARREIPGHKCPSCGLVYCPPRGFCPLCVVMTGDDDEVAVDDRGTVTTFTVITPIQYRGQEERDDYVLAEILLDGADQSIGQQRLGGIDNAEVRAGLRVEAAWRDEPSAEGQGFGGAIEHWRPTGEPDVDPDQFGGGL